MKILYCNHTDSYLYLTTNFINELLVLQKTSTCKSDKKALWWRVNAVFGRNPYD